MPTGNMIGSKIGDISNIANSPVRIDPCMKFNSSCMTFTDHELHRVPGFTGFITVSFDRCKIKSPWLDSTRIHCIGLAAYLYKHGGDSCFQMMIDNGKKCIPLLL